MEFRVTIREGSLIGSAAEFDLEERARLSAVESAAAIQHAVLAALTEVRRCPACLLDVGWGTHVCRQTSADVVS